jgi:hypothetical protein
MKRLNLSVLWFTLLLLFLLISSRPVNAGVLEDAKFDYLFIGNGFEYMSYTEHEPETGTYTNTSIYNVVTKFEGSASLRHLFFDIKGVLPVLHGQVQEGWERYGRVYQTNNLEYSWVRLDGNMGYRIYPWLSPYLGIRWSRQKRSNFILSEPVNMESIETCRSLFATAGLKGFLKHSSQWEFGYSFEYFMPVYSRTENTALPGWKNYSKDGYAIGARALARYIYSSSVSLYYELSGERAYWDGSCWIDYPGGSAKWPENETISLKYILGIAWVF